MSEEKLSKKVGQDSETSVEQLSPEVLDMIKHPPKIDDTIRDLPPDERKTNPTVAPEILDNRPQDIG
ncbi:MAG: hypothetical protein IGS39_06070 [Calothrix sp. C42_A2020_038]|nr:hypothetical protein [Calothrix sp. C42_A2020_038]